jgi:hypothetical protein
MKMEDRENKIAQRDEESLSGEYSRIINLEMWTGVKRPYVPQIQILATSF